MDDDEYREAWKRTDARLREERRRLREGERMLETWATEYKKRDAVIRSAVAAGISVRRVQQVTGIARTTVARILADGPAAAHNQVEGS